MSELAFDVQKYLCLAPDEAIANATVHPRVTFWETTSKKLCKA